MDELCALELFARDGVPVARLRGEIDLSNADSLLRALENAVDDDSRGLVVDLTEVGYLDSAGVRLLFRLSRTVRDAGAGLRVVTPVSARIRRVLELADITRTIPLDETEDDAISSFRDA